LLLYGYALNWDIRHVRLAVEDRDRTPESREIVAAFVNSGYFDLVASIDDTQVTRFMNTDAVRAILVIPAGLGRDVRGARRVPVQLIVNGDNANTATTVVGYSTTILQNVSKAFLRVSLPAAAAPGPP